MICEIWYFCEFHSTVHRIDAVSTAYEIFFSHGVLIKNLENKMLKQFYVVATKDQHKVRERCPFTVPLCSVVQLFRTCVKRKKNSCYILKFGNFKILNYGQFWPCPCIKRDNTSTVQASRHALVKFERYWQLERTCDKLTWVKLPVKVKRM